jgi:glycosyltransferase involved in cell wall biosynthesis
LGHSERKELHSKEWGLVLLANIPAPYNIPVWNELDRLTGGRLEVRFMSRSNARRTWSVPVNEMEFEWAVLSDSEPAGFLAAIKTGAAVGVFLLRHRPGAIICGGYDALAHWVTLCWCKIFRRRLVLWTESNARDSRQGGRIKAWLKRWFVSRSDAIAALGQAASDYARQLGAPQEKIVVAPFGCNHAFFVQESSRVDAAGEKALWGYPPRLILYAGRLVPEKGVLVLLDAFRMIAADFSHIGLLFVGHGPAQKHMEDHCRHTGLDRVFFAGPQEYKRMPYFYALADILVLPTLSDPYGYVVIEAFACGVPALVSRVAGVCDDAIIEGETGFSLEPGDAHDLAGKILVLLRDEALRIRMSANCRRLARRYSVQACAGGLLQAVLGVPSAPRQLTGDRRILQRPD